MGFIVGGVYDLWEWIVCGVVVLMVNVCDDVWFFELLLYIRIEFVLLR